MATSFWNSSGSTWAAASFTPAGVPAANGHIFVPANASQDIESGAATPLDYDSFVTADESTIDVGSSGTPCKIQADEIDLRGRGDVYIKHDYDTANNWVTDRFIIRPSNPEAKIVVTSDEGAANEITLFQILSGDVEISMAGTIPSVMVSRRRDVSPTKVVLTASCGALANLEVAYGKVVARNAVTMARVHAGASFIYTTGVLTAATIAGHMEYTSPNNIATLHALPGSTLDFTRATTTDGDVITITDLFYWEGSTILGLDNNVTVTNPHRMDGIA